MRYIIRPGDPEAAGRLGGKAEALAALRRTGLRIPEWFVLAPEAFYSSMSEDERQALAATGDSGTIHSFPERLTLGPMPRHELEQALARICPNGERVAVRSSACDEDGFRHSFAGQLDSFLFVHPSEVAESVVAVWRSAFNERALAYRRQKGLPAHPRPPAVLVQRMVNASRSGVAFGMDPITGRRGVAVIAALLGLGTALVSGEGAADTYHVDREGRILNRDIADKGLAHRPSPGCARGYCSVGVSLHEAKLPALKDEEVRAVAKLVRETGRHFGCPQDIEWAIEDGRLYLLQSRPITSHSGMVDPDGVLNLWDNSNIAESYGGVTTPLTFSFARRAYEEVYRQFCRIMRVPAVTVAAHDDTFRRMLGLIRGRVYYNLLSWYRVLALLPGFTLNRRFMEQMMGVREEVPADLVAGLPRATWRDRLVDSFRLLLTLTGLLVNHFFLPKRIEGFYRRFNSSLAPTNPGLEDMRADELVAHYRHLERQLLTKWDAPLVNDFFAMVFFGVLRRLAGTWCDDPGGTLQNDLLSGEGGIISIEPATRVHEMARMAAKSPDFSTLLCKGSLDSILDAMEGMHDFSERYRGYLEKFGDRCPDELKLESPTLQHDPLPLLRSVGQLARHLRLIEALPTAGTGAQLRLQAERRVTAALGRQPVRRIVFTWVLRHARARVRDRENLRFERTRLFGHVRRIFLEFGKRFSELGLLDTPRDIFYLEVDEILGFVEGTATTTNLRGLVVLRKKEYEGYRESEGPPHRFETRGIVPQGKICSENGKYVEVSDGEQRQGIGCCRGIVRGPVRLIRDPKNAVLRKGEILVAERTDPGWIILFPSALGLLVERGSLLSHSAIVSREMGVPAIVSISGLTRWLHDGDWVEFDGSTGVVRRIKCPQEVAGHA